MATSDSDLPMADLSSPHSRHHEYTYRLPTPPRIVVPPPTATAEVPELHITGASTAEEDIDVSFLKELNLESTIQKNTLLEWSYDRRRQAQMILPWLYLGPLTAAKDREWLRRAEVTMVLAIRSRPNSMTGAIQAATESCQEVATIEAADYHALIRQLSDITKFINRHLSRLREFTKATGSPRLGKVLVFCESGNEKAAAVVAAYLMETLDDFDHIKSMQVCQTQRFCVNFDDSIKNMLRSYWDILSARRTVERSISERQKSLAKSIGPHNPLASLQLPQGSILKPKRSIEEIDGDVDMSDEGGPSDLLRFSGRDNTPFADS